VVGFAFPGTVLVVRLMLIIGAESFVVVDVVIIIEQLAFRPIRWDWFVSDHRIVWGERREVVGGFLLLVSRATFGRF
jgi:hypothetical protein